MNVSEIEIAVDQLSQADCLRLLRHLQLKLLPEATQRAKVVANQDGRAILLAPPEAPEMTPQLIHFLLEGFI